MIYTLHTDNNLIYAYVVFYTKDSNGNFVNQGEYIHVEDMWIHENFRNTNIIKILIDYIDKHPETKNSKWVYWRRSKYDRLSKTYHRSNFVNKENVYGR